MKVDRAEIAMDIVQRKLSRSDIERLCQDEEVQANFFGAGYAKKRPMSEWDEEYLKKLYGAVVGESFNRDYLLYLDQVAEYVQKRKRKKIRNTCVLGIIVVLVIAVGATFIWHMTTHATP